MIKLRVPLALLVAFGCNACQQTKPATGPTTPQHVLVLIAANDPVGSFDGLEATLTKNLAKLRGIELHFQRLSNARAFRTTIQDMSQAHGPLSALILAFHGKSNRLHLGKSDSLNQRNLKSICQGLSATMKPEAPVILYSCLTGEGEDNLAADLAQTLKREVIAPTRFWLMQTAVPLEQRVPELRLDGQGQLAVDTDQFALYYKRRLDSGKDRHLIAPTSMDALCCGDGFERRPSKFRPLFHRHTPRGHVFRH